MNVNINNNNIGNFSHRLPSRNNISQSHTINSNFTSNTNNSLNNSTTSCKVYNNQNSRNNNKLLTTSYNSNFLPNNNGNGSFISASGSNSHNNLIYNSRNIQNNMSYKLSRSISRNKSSSINSNSISGLKKEKYPRNSSHSPDLKSGTIDTVRDYLHMKFNNNKIKLK